ncbi:hypothetical protein KFL_002920060 [Klebsormidium nitens]|uniref:Uncharacterized protein n=1 Tax=Klebsormidium nitens TaxID=105231 RepID=A0A1Y1IAN3_KLENI|nr:hypothetical protein KFL_002920060 [Klebsormidium nitens]|eukprot:GAQ86489.1 hypothetical protein KFL_002920060 [Klebsormidium nitens]
MAASVQLQTSAATKPCTSKFGASAARGNAASTRPFVHLPLTDFTKTFLAGALDFHLKSSEQALVGSRIRVKASASAGREQKGAHISRSREVPHGSSHSRSMRTTTSRAVAVGTGDAEHVTVQSHSAGVSIDVEGKTCIACHRVKPLIDFQKAGKGLRASCRACVAVSLADRSGKDMYHLSMSVDEAWAHAKQCSKCRVVKELRDFAPNKKTKDGVQTRCRACNAVAVVERMPDEPAADGAWTNDVQDNNGHQNGAVAQSFQLPEADNSYTLPKEPAHVEAPAYSASFSAAPAVEEKDDIIIPQVEPTYVKPTYVEPTYQAREPEESTHEASEMVADLQLKLLRLDLDLANARAGKAIFEDQVQYLHRVMETRTDDNEKLRSALADASSSVAQLAVHVDRLESETSNLREKLLRLDFDLVHARTTRGILDEKVDDLERALAADTEASRVRDEKLRTALEEATSSNAIMKAELEAAQSEGTELRTKALNLSMDLAHVAHGKKILDSKVDDLERVLAADAETSRAREEMVATALVEAEAAIGELERLTAETSALRSSLLCKDFDLTHASATKALLSARVDDFEKAMDTLREEEETLKAAYAKANAANAELEAQVAALQEEQSNLRGNVMNFSLDLTHSKAMRKIFEEQVQELERTVAAYEETAQERAATMKAALEESSAAIAEYDRLNEEASALRMQVLRLDMDLSHTRATKQILGAQVDDLERELGATRLEDEMLKTALADASEANAVLEAGMAIVQEEGTALKEKVLCLSLDLAHVSAGRRVYGERVDDLERLIQADAQRSQARDEKLAAALASNITLEAEAVRMMEEGDEFRTQLLRRDFDIAHAVALKRLLDERVDDLERTIAEHDDAGAKLKAALSTNAELEAEMEHLVKEGGSLRTQVLMKDFDLTHADALKGMLGERVQDLERAIEAHEDLGAKLRAAYSSNAELQAEVGNLKEEGDSLRTQMLRQDFDLTHTRAMKAIFAERCADLEKVIAEHDDMTAQLKAANYTMEELNAQVAHLEAERSTMQTKLLSKDFDITHIHAMKSILNQKVEDLERTIADHDDLGTQLRASQSTNAELVAEVERLGEEGNFYRTQALSKDFDLSHMRALKAILDDKVNDLERVIAAHDEMVEKLAEVQQANAVLQAEVEQIASEKGDLQTQLLFKDFDLTHTEAMKAMLDDKVQDLERVIAAHDDLGTKLKAAYDSEAQLEARVARLEAEGGDLKTKLLLQDFDLTNTRSLKSILHDKVEDLERVIAAHDDLGAKLKAARSANTELESHVDWLEAKEGMLQTQLLRKDFDLAHTQALKAILDDKVLFLERSVEDLDVTARERLEKLKEALAEAEISNSELERLRAEGGALQFNMLKSDFDLGHERHTKSILAEKVDDLERMIASYDEVAQVRDTSLSEALSLIEQLETGGERLERERDMLRTNLLRHEFDLCHANATKAILGDRVESLEAQGELLQAALGEALTSKGELEEKVETLTTALKDAQKEERALRQNQSVLKRQVFNLKMDNSAMNRTKVKRSEILASKERELAEVEQALAAAQNEIAQLTLMREDAQTAMDDQESANQSEKQWAGLVSLSESVQQQEEKSLQEALSLISRLEDEVARLEAEGGEFRSRVLSQDLDLSHIRATKAMLDGRVQDLEAKGEKLSTELEEVMSSKGELADKAGYLEGVLRAIQTEERSLRGDQTELKKQLFNLKVDNMALHRAKSKRAELLETKEKELAELTQSLAQMQKEAAYLVKQLADARTVQAGNDRRGYGSDSDDEPSVGKQLAKIASLTVAVQRKDKDAKGDAKAQADVDSDDDDEITPDPETEQTARKAMNAAGASVLLSSMLGLSLSFGSPTMAPPLRAAMPQISTMFSAPNPVEQLAELSNLEDITAEMSEVGSSEVEKLAEIEGGGFDPIDEAFEVETLKEEGRSTRSRSNYPDSSDSPTLLD